MKQWTIPLINRTVRLYSGPKEWKRWRKDLEKHGGADLSEEPDEAPKGAQGRACGSFVWVSDKDDVDTVAHELSHCIDDMMESLGSKDSELRAHITGWLFRKWAGKRR